MEVDEWSGKVSNCLLGNMRPITGWKNQKHKRERRVFTFLNCSSKMSLNILVCKFPQRQRYVQRKVNVANTAPNVRWMGDHCHCISLGSCPSKDYAT